MIERLAQIADTLDSLGRYASADAYTVVLKRYADNALTDWDEEVDEEGIAPYQWDRDIMDDEIAIDDPSIIRWLQTHGDPAFVQRYLEVLEAAQQAGRGKATEKTFGGAKLHFPPGMVSKFGAGDAPFRPSDFVNFFIGHQKQMQNADRAREWLKKKTRGGTYRAHLGIDYPQSTEKDPNRRMIKDPHLEAWKRSIEMPESPHAPKQVSHLMPMYDPHYLRSIFDADYEDRDEKIFEKAWTPREGSPEMNPQQLMSHALGSATRNFDPRIIQKMQGVPKMGPKGNYYLKVK